METSPTLATLENPGNPRGFDIKAANLLFEV
jgi:hypothetical protein